MSGIGNAVPLGEADGEELDPSLTRCVVPAQPAVATATLPVPLVPGAPRSEAAEGDYFCVRCERKAAVLSGNAGNWHICLACGHTREVEPAHA